MRRRIRWATLGFVVATAVVLWLVGGSGEPWRSATPFAKGSDRAEAPGTNVSPEPAPEAAGGTVAGGSSRSAARLVRVRVVTPAGPLEGAELRIDGEDAVAVTSPDGVGEIGTDDVDVVWVRASKEGFIEAEGELPGGVDEAEVFLLPGVPLRGQVVRAADKKPVAGASVQAADRASGDELCRVLRTDAEGRFTVPGVAPGTHFVVGAAFEGYAPAATTGVAAAGAADIRIVLGHGATLTGAVRGSDGKPAEGVALRVFLADDWWLARFHDSDTMQQSRLRAAARAVTGADGSYKVEGLAPGEHTVLAFAASGASAKSSVAVPAGGVVKLDLTLEPTGSILVRVLDAAGRPVPGARIGFYDAKAKWLYGPRIATATDAKGEGLATGLDPGAYEVLVQPARLTPARARVVVERGPPADVEIRVDPGLALEGTVRDSAGSPVAGLGIRFGTPGDARDPPQEKTAVTSRDGRFVLEGLLPLPGTLTVSDWAERWTSWGGDALPGGPSLSIVVRETASVSGRFEPAPASRRVAYTVTAGDESRSWGVDLDAEGRFVLVGMEEGEPLTLCFDVPGGRPTRCAVAALAPGERRDLGTLVVTPGRTLRGHAADGSGRPWAFTRIELSYEDDDIQKHTLTDGNGRFVFENVDPEARITITVWNAESTGQPFELEDWTKEPVHELVVQRPAGR